MQLSLLCLIAAYLLRAGCALRGIRLGPAALLTAGLWVAVVARHRNSWRRGPGLTGWEEGEALHGRIMQGCAPEGIQGTCREPPAQQAGDEI